MDRPLTTKQKLYTEGILRGLTGIQAAMEAGYKGSDNVLMAISSQNLRKLKIKEELAKRRAEIEAKTDYNSEYLRQEHRRYADLAEKKLDYATATRNIELIGKTFGAYIDKSINLDLNLGRRPLDAQEAIEHSRKMIDSVPIKNPDEP